MIKKTFFILFLIFLFSTYGCIPQRVKPINDEDLMSMAEKSAADSKVSALPELAVTPDDADLIYIIDSTTSKKITVINLLSGKADSLGSDDNYVTDAEKVIVGNTTGTNSGNEPDANLTTKGIVELATGAETVTGTDATIAVTPDGLTDKLAEPGNIGETTPGSGTFTTITTSASATPTLTLEDSDLLGTDEEAAKIFANGTTLTDGSEVTDLTFTYMDAGTVTNAIIVDGSDNQVEFQINTTFQVNDILEPEISFSNTPTDGYISSYNSGGTNQTWIAFPVEIGVAASDETTDLTTGTAKVTFRAPYAFTLTEVRANVNTAPVGAALTIDIEEAGTTVLSTLITIDVTEKTSETAATPPVISDSAIADDAEITIDIDVIGSSTAGKGLKIWLIGTRIL